MERLNPTRSRAHQPLIQVMLAWQNFAGPRQGRGADLALGDLQVTPCRSTPTPLAWIWRSRLSERCTDDGEPAGIGGAVEFRTDVFDAASIEALIERLERVLVAMTADPTPTVVVDRSCWMQAERARLDEWATGRC